MKKNDYIYVPITDIKSALPLNIPIRKHEYKNDCDICCNYLDTITILAHMRSLHTHTHTHTHIYIYMYIYV